MTPLTLAGYALGHGVPFAERVRAAADAGFAGIGLRVEDYVAAREAGLTDADLLAMLAACDLAVTEVEYVTEWGRALEKERTVFHMARTFGVPHVNAGLIEALPEPEIARELCALCERAEELVIGVEFMPYSGIPTVGAAARLIDGLDNAGVIVDSWHWARSNARPEDLEPVPAERIVSIQLNDVQAEPMTPLRMESLHHRLPPGRGYGDVPGMLRALAAHGVGARLISVEIISDELAAQGPDVAARTAFETASEVSPARTPPCADARRAARHLVQLEERRDLHGRARLARPVEHLV